MSNKNQRLSVLRRPAGKHRRDAGAAPQPGVGQKIGRKSPVKPVTLAPVQHLAASDPRLAVLIAQARPFAVQAGKFVRPFDALFESIVYQQLSGKAAATIFGRVRALYPRRKWFSPELVIATPDEKLRAAGLSRSKTAAIKDLAAKTLDGTVPTRAALDRMSDEEIIVRLTTVRGIGRWTVEMMLLFDLGRLDVWPVDDYGVRKGYARTFRKKELPKPKELFVIGERWRPYRSVAAWYFWRALDLPEKVAAGRA
jgi:DNA-3-methyladenine glycosylase II